MPNLDIFDHRICTLGEGAFWHPLREQFFWFDIVEKKLLTATENGPAHWQFTECVSAAGWLDSDTLLMASESGLYRFSLDTGVRQLVCAIEADNPLTRSNDGRADPSGGFWIGTMGKQAQTGLGAIYRFYRGELRKLIFPVTIPNAICFAPNGEFMYYADTRKNIIWRQPLDGQHGWPKGTAEIFIDCGAQGVSPDGAVTDAAGNLWNAQWGASRIACYSPSGQFISQVSLPTQHISCPAFGGSDFTTLYATSATAEISPELLTSQPDAGKTFRLIGAGQGRPEPQVIL